MPQLSFFKAGYRHKQVMNAYESSYLDKAGFVGDPVRASYWNGKNVNLEKFAGSLAEYAREVGRFPVFRGVTSCPWKETPLYYAALLKERERLEGEGIRSTLPTIGRLESSFASLGCGSAAEFFKGYVR